jgi:hypothetical protein
MSRPTQRVSQLITTFGPGAMVDLPTRSVVIGGLERWRYPTAKSLELINEPRLSERIGNILKQTGRLDQTKTLSLRKPPVEKETTYREPAGIDVTVFPQWFVSEQSVTRQVPGGREVRRRRLVYWSALDTAGGRRKFEDDSGPKPKKVEVTPIRFVGSCQDGHLQDVDWRWAVHQTLKCEEIMWLEEVGTTADPSDTSIVCDCGRSLSLRDAFAPGRLGTCRGERPWLGDIDPTRCAHPLRLLTRTATNAYFPQVATVISLPSSEDRLTELVRDHLSDLRTAQLPQDVALAKKFNERIRATLDGYSDDEIFSRLRQLVEGMTADTKEPAKIAEFDVFASRKTVIGQNSPQSRLFGRTLERRIWDVNPRLDLSAVAHVVAVDRLREVSCLYGFTRFEAAPLSTDGDLEDIALAVNGAPLSRDADWLPAIEQLGEGVFLHFDEERIRAWLQIPEVSERIDLLGRGYREWALTMPGKRTPFPGGPYFLLHSLSHLLMAELAMECGYPASSLKERIYALADETVGGGPLRCGILVYTASTGAQGTLGGLVATASRIAFTIEAALRRAQVCSNDPICADHAPDKRSGDRASHGAACHGCLLVAETSCEMRNMFLDRALLIETMQGACCNFFSLNTDTV